MKIRNCAVFALAGIAATSIYAHGPLPGEWHSRGGGGITQNVIVGPIKHKPVNNAPVAEQAAFDPSIELGNSVVPGGATPLLHVSAVFLGREWQDHSFAKNKIAKMNRFFRGYEASDYAASINEYIGPEFPDVSLDIHYDGYLIDPDVVLDRESPNRVAVHLCKLFDEGKLALHDSRSSYIAVFSSHKRPTGQSCGWHGWSMECGSSGFLFSFSYNLDGDAECDPQDQVTGNSQGVAALANESARSLADVRTDGNFWGWTQVDASGNEVDDMCAWTFSVPFVTFPDGSKWKLQDLWSNEAYEAGTGHPNAAGQKGCVTGK